MLSKRLKAKLIFNVSDLWPESAEKLGLVTNKAFLKLAYNLEKKCYNKSFLITGQTNGIVQSIRSRFPDKDVYWLPNGVDLSFYNPENINSTFRKNKGFEDKDLLLFYGGIIGYAQGLDLILRAAEKLKEYSNIKFILQGSGPEKARLLEMKKVLNLDNVFFFNPVGKKEMPAILAQIDVALVPLKKLELFTGAIPSKIFEALSMKKPLLLGVDGEAKGHFIDKANAGFFFEPENEDDLIEKILQFFNNKELILEMGSNGRDYVNKNFNRDNISSGFYKKLKLN